MSASNNLLRGISLAVTLTLTALSGCTVSAENSALSANDAGAGGGSSATSLTVSFLDGDTVTLNAGEARREVVVRVRPGRGHQVRFAILPDSGAPNDASLSDTTRTTDDDGEARVFLNAPSTPVTFSLRASVGDTAATLSVSVSAEGYARVQATPEYKGMRAVDEWTASVRAGTTCSELTGTPPTDGALVATAPSGFSPRLENVPVDAVLAVALRAGEYIYGCRTIQSLIANQLNTVIVQVSDRPIRLDQTNLDVTLDLDESDTAWTAHLQEAVGEALLGLRGDSLNDAEALLDGMREVLSAGDVESFDTERAARGWDAVVASALPSGDLPITQAVQAWMTNGVTTLEGEGFLAGSLTSNDTGEQNAILVLDTVAGLDAEQAGFVPSLLSTWTADPGDTVLLGTRALWFPSLLVTELAEREAITEQPEAADAPEALEAIIDCAAIADAIVQTSLDEESYFGCNATCTANLCADGLEQLWQRAWDASESPVSLHVSATGRASVDNQARPATFEGTWLGTFEETNQATLGGVIQGSTPPSLQAPE